MPLIDQKIKKARVPRRRRPIKVAGLGIRTLLRTLIRITQTLATVF
jgi:hypothetical protein